ncbi:MAG: FG-GAP-like repeat-containing protein [Ignavibacteria bacterium]
MLFYLKILLFRPLCLSILLSAPIDFLYAQYFVKVTDPNNPIVTEPLSGSYIGTSWVDVDNDERIDLFICRKDIFKNLGGGNFVKLTGSFAVQGTVIGNSWADYDNDGDIDLFVVSTTQSTPSSHLYRNEGNGVFTKITAGTIGDSANNTGWGCSWGDYNNDAYPDLIIAAAFGFGGVTHTNRLFFNNGDGTFTRIDTTSVTDTTAPFTIPVWSDYDQDCDIDLFIGSGPATGIPARDYLFRNFLSETNIPYFQRIDTGIIGTDLVDGQNWNWIDYDNDGDLDAFLTNYSSGIPNRLYRCQGIRYYVRMTEAQVGTIVSDAGRHLANLWGDFDNDGDLDCFITRDLTQTSRYYKNNGNGTFTRIDTLAVVTGAGPGFGAAAGDYDNDGDLDLFVAGTSTSKGLYRNETQNSNKWVNIRCEGSGPNNNFSNKSALGTIVRAKATINGNPTWQIREVNAQNSFNSMNMLNVHFGLGDASVIDSLMLKWPRGLIQVFTNVVVNKFYKAIEGQGLNEIVIGITKLETEIPNRYKLHQNYPNPFNQTTKIKFDLPKSSNIKISVYDATGKELTNVINQNLPAGSYETVFDTGKYSSGIYFYSIQADSYFKSRKMILVK